MNRNTVMSDLHAFAVGALKRARWLWRWIVGKRYVPEDLARDGVVIPATAGSTALVLNVWDDGLRMSADGRLESDERVQYGLAELPIVAWRAVPSRHYDGRSYCVPILPDDLGGTVALLLPDGRVHVPFHATYQSRDDFVRVELEVFVRARKERQMMKDFRPAAAQVN